MLNTKNNETKMKERRKINKKQKKNKSDVNAVLCKTIFLFSFCVSFPFHVPIDELSLTMISCTGFYSILLT